MAANSFPTHDDSGDEPDGLNEHMQEPGDPDGLVAAEEQQRWQERHPAPSPTPRAVVKPKRRWPVFLLIVVLVVAAAFGAYWVGNHEASKHQAPKKAPQASSKSQGAATQPAVTQTKHYDSTNYTLGFDYPKTWVVSDTTVKLTITSPALSLMTAVGSKVNAHVVVTIQNQQTNIKGFPAGGAVASLQSDKLTYKQPSSIQRAQTYLSYLSYTEQNGLDALYVTGDNGYQQGQQVPMSDIVQGNPLISVGFVTCASDTCASDATDSVTLQASSWKSAAASKDVVNLIESIVLNS